MPRLRITLKRSTIGCTQDQRGTVKALGLRRLHQSVVQPDSPSIRGMVSKVSHLLEVETLDNGSASA